MTRLESQRSEVEEAVRKTTYLPRPLVDCRFVHEFEGIVVPRHVGANVIYGTPTSFRDS